MNFFIYHQNRLSGFNWHFAPIFGNGLGDFVTLTHLHAVLKLHLKLLLFFDGTWVFHLLLAECESSHVNLVIVKVAQELPVRATERPRLGLKEWEKFVAPHV